MENGGARAHVQTHSTLDMCKALLLGPYSHTKFERNPPYRLRDMEEGCAREHVQMHCISDMCKALI